MSDISWTNQAVDDLKAIHDLIARDASAYAELLVEEMLERVESQAEAPESGAALPEAADPEVRQFVHAAFRFIYRTRGGTLQMLAICPGCNTE